MLRTKGTDRTFAFRALSPLACRAQAYSTRRVGVTPETESSPRPASPTSEHIPAVETHVPGPVPGQIRGQSHLNTTSPSVGPVTLQNRLGDWGVLTSASLRRRADELSKQATATFSHLGQHLNRVTGYEEIEALKRRVVEREAQIKATRRAAREAKTAYEDAVLQRSISQRQVNDLLQRKSSWTENDVSNFTSLVRSDHFFEQEEARTKVRVAETEDAVDREFSELMRVILARYHEEQVWSDKIRSASTYGSLAVLGVNLVVFMMAIIVVEPWKRKKLAQTFEKKVEELGAETKAAMNAGTSRLEERLTRHEKLLTELFAQSVTETRQGSPTAETASKESYVPPRITPSRQQIYFYPSLGVIGSRDLMLVAGSAAAGGVITLLARSFFTN